MKIFYDKRQTAKDANSFSPSPEKPELVMASWRKLNLPLEIMRFDPATRDQIAQVHDRSYVDGVLDLTHQNGFGNCAPGVAKALPWVCGSVVAACIHAALYREIVASPTSGAHHATYSWGGGFCTFNSICLGAFEALASGLADGVGIFDRDQHHSNGTDDILRRKRKNIVSWDLGASDVDIDNAEAWLDKLPGLLRRLYKDCDLIIYNAGVDCHIEDPLGGRFTSEQIYRCDKIVFDYCTKHGKGCVFTLAGGYQTPIENVLALHDGTILAWADSIGVRKMAPGRFR